MAGEFSNIAPWIQDESSNRAILVAWQLTLFGQLGLQKAMGFPASESPVLYASWHTLKVTAAPSSLVAVTLFGPPLDYFSDEQPYPKQI